MAGIGCQEEGEGYIWRKYGEKTVGVRKGAFKRSYFRCACSQANPQCGAKKRVDRLVCAARSEAPLSVCYITQHNHAPHEGVPELEAKEATPHGASKVKTVAEDSVKNALQGLENMRPEDLAKEMYHDLLVQIRAESALNGTGGSCGADRVTDDGAAGPSIMDLDEIWDDDTEDPLSIEAYALLCEIFDLPLSQDPAAASDPASCRGGDTGRQGAVTPCTVAPQKDFPESAGGDTGRQGAVPPCTVAPQEDFPESAGGDAGRQGAVLPCTVAPQKDFPESAGRSRDSCQMEIRVPHAVKTTENDVAAAPCILEREALTPIASPFQAPPLLPGTGSGVTGLGVVEGSDRDVVEPLYHEAPVLNTAASSTKKNISEALQRMKNTTEDCDMAAGLEMIRRRMHARKYLEPATGAPSEQHLPVAKRFCTSMLDCDAQYAKEPAEKCIFHAGGFFRMGEASSVDSRYSVDESCDLPTMEFPEWDFDALPSMQEDVCTMFAG